MYEAENATEQNLMDKAQEENNGSAEEESGQYLWIAGAFVGGFLILMIIIIIGILVWRHVKKQNTSTDQNWAGPSPLADGNIPEEGSGMNSSILGRSMSLSHISTCPIFSNEDQTVQDAHEMDGEMQQRHFKENKANQKKLTPLNIPTVPAVPTKNLLIAPEAKISTEITGNGFNNDTCPLPPHDLPKEFPLPPSPDAFAEQDLKDNYLQSIAEMKSQPQDRNSTQEPLNLQISDMDALHITNNLENQLFPPPPPDL